MENKQKNTNKSNNNKKNKFNFFKDLTYPKIVELYKKYPDNNMKYSLYNKNNKETTYFNFPSQEEFALGWRVHYSGQRRDALFLQTQLHYLPEYLWKNLSYDETSNILNGYRVRDRQNYYFINLSETDSITRDLFNLLHQRTINREELEQSLRLFEDNGMEDSWLYIRGQNVLSMSSNNLIVMPKVLCQEPFTSLHSLSL